MGLHNIELPSAKKEEEHEPFVPSGMNARVISRAESKAKFPASSRKRIYTKPSGNIEIEQGVYKPKERSAKAPESGIEFFADHLANKKTSHLSRSQKKSVVKSPFKKDERRPAPTPAAKVHKKATTSADLVKKTEVTIDEMITVKEFSEKIGVPLPEVMKKLISNGIMTSLNASLDFDTASLIAEDLGVVLKKKEAVLDVESFME